MDAQRWNTLIQSYDGSFLQSWEWGEFQQRYGRSVYRVHTAQAAVQLIAHALPAGRTYLFAPYGPVGAASEAAELLDHILQVARKEQAIFVRYEGFGEQLGGKQVSEVHPQFSWVLTLSDPEDMLASMKSKWRYNIRLAERKGVRVRSSRSVTDVTMAYPVLKNTAQRQGIRIHPQSYYQLMLDELGPQDMARLYLAEYEGTVIAANLMVGYGDTMTYVHGGSDSAYKSVMAPHALQWQAIQDAATAGYMRYDFFGVAPDNAPHHPWAGITRFKQGFGGEYVEYAGTWELPLQRMWYNAYTMAKKMRK